MNPLLLTDFYKVHHNKMYPEGMTKLYSNFTPRKSRMPGVNHVVVFGVQHFILEYLIKKFDKDFFGYGGNWSVNWRKGNKAEIVEEYKRHTGVDTKHIEALWDLGYLPIEIKALPEGTICPIGVPVLTITNTHPDFAWLVNYLETLLSCCLWQPITSATIANEYRKLLTKYAIETTGTDEFVQWQGHDFSMRGMSSPESAILSGMGHLTAFSGTDTIPAIYQLEDSYAATGLIGASVPATEHSVMCMGTKEAEIDTFKRLLKLYPEGILSVVSDTWNLWDVCAKFLPLIKEEVLARDGKLVIRPDSGDPVKIICGYTFDEVVPEQNLQREVIGYHVKATGKFIEEEERKGVIELLWDTFGGKVNNYGFKELDSHIGAIYGDSITLDRARAICEGLKAKGFASTNVVLGIGSYTYQYNTRDTFGFAMKATYGEVLESTCHNVCQENELIGENTDICKDGCVQATPRGREIFKAPITDSGEKKSKKGLMYVLFDPKVSHDYYVVDQCTKEEEKTGFLETVFLDGKLVKNQTLEEIRHRVRFPNETLTVLEQK